MRTRTYLAGFLAVAMAAAGSARASDLEKMEECYYGVSWYSWDHTYHGGQALATTSVDLIDDDFILLHGNYKDEERAAEGLYLYVRDNVFFYAFETIPDPSHELSMKITFESRAGNLRRLRVKLAQPPGQEPVVRSFANWGEDANVPKLEGEEVDGPQTLAPLRQEIIKALKGFKPTYDKQMAHAARTGRQSVADGLRKQFLRKLDQCLEVEASDVKAAALQEKARFGSSAPTPPENAKAAKKTTPPAEERKAGADDEAPQHREGSF